jgi:hypothetical protein
MTLDEIEARVNAEYDAMVKANTSAYGIRNDVSLEIETWRTHTLAIVRAVFEIASRVPIPR